MVLVEFVDGNMADPIITACFNSPNNPIQATAAEAPQIKRQMNGTSETIAKDGTRIIHVAKDEAVEIIGDGTVTIGGTLTVNVTDAVTIKSTSGTITLDAATVHCTEDFTVAGKITATGNIESTAGDVSDKVRSMADDRIIFDTHPHTCSAPGELSSPPTTPE
jgi:phage baseplate assembly protein gpV